MSLALLERPQACHRRISAAQVVTGACCSWWSWRPARSCSRILGSAAGAVSGILPALAIDAPYRAARGEAEMPCSTTDSRMVQVTVSSSIAPPLRSISSRARRVNTTEASPRGPNQPLKATVAGEQLSYEEGTKQRPHQEGARQSEGLGELDRFCQAPSGGGPEQDATGE